MVGLGFGGALRGFERCVWSVTLYLFILFLFSFLCVGLSFVFLSFFLLLDVLRC